MLMSGSANAFDRFAFTHKKLAAAQLSPQPKNTLLQRNYIMTERYDEALASNLDYISQTIRDRVIFQSKYEPDAITLWIAGTYLMDHWTRFPKLLIVSPERECGKTTALEAIEGFVVKGKMTSSITAAALTRSIQKDAPTVLIDEADLTLQDNKQLQAIVNAGHTRRSAVRILSDEAAGKKWEPKEMSLWCPQVITGIGDFEDTLISRSISIGLRRKGINEEIIYLDDRYFDEQTEMRSALENWSITIDPEVLLRVPPVPDGVGNRMRDNWLPLLQIAQLAGVSWVEKCNDAIQELEIKRKVETSALTVNDLLMDLREVLSTFTGPEIESNELLQLLLFQSDGDWHSANNGRTITSKWLAMKLRPYGIMAQRRSKCNVYMLADFEDAFKRYLPPI